VGFVVTVGGGDGNRADGLWTTVGGGSGNWTSGFLPTVGGGGLNSASGDNATVAGGEFNSASGVYATVGGGYHNQATNSYATVPGGYQNSAGGQYSFAAGHNAVATNDGAFVWSDGTGTPTSSTASNQFVARASGGFVLYSSTNSNGVSLAAGGGSWSSMSDRDAKKDFAPLNSQALLARVAALPLTSWSYKSEPGVRHLGPMAQDFYAAFGVGEDDRHITEVDEGGVALAAIQGLNQKVEEKEARIREQAAQIQSQTAEITELKARLDKLEQLISAKNGGRQ